jgi:hypothetical protein
MQSREYAHSLGPREPRLDRARATLRAQNFAIDPAVPM